VNLAAYRERLDQKDEELAARYWNRESVEALLKDRANLLDDILAEAFNQQFADTGSDMALVAVGGYGRGEVHPGSDVDVLILASKPQKQQKGIEAYVRFLFDLGLDVGYAVRTPKDCRKQAQADITIATAMMERRQLAGSKDLYNRLERELAHRKLWPPDAFFAAKRDEQNARHKRFDNVEYGLEPNLKESPGGLRDLHTAMWICLSRYGTSDPLELARLGVLTDFETNLLIDGRRFLSWIRFGLHLLAGRREDRLQFEHQRALAQRLGYADTEAMLGVERFMHSYYRYVLGLREVNDIVIQSVAQEIEASKGKPSIEVINERFALNNSNLETRTPDVFSKTPSAMLEMFVLMANRRDVSGVSAATIRQIRDHVHLIDDAFRHDPVNTALFIDLLKAPYTLVTQLTRMRRYGILSRYIPEFGRVVGQMQHDLFHIYTVDAHTMMVIGNMRRFRYRSAAENFPVAAHCVNQIPKIELLYIAGLYHDIGKGRGGDHSALGARDVVAFCKQHNLNEDDIELAAWLVEHHLTMSSTAQRKDIYDPDEVFEFASFVKSERRLHYLYALTVADINATNPTLWNGYRATLLRALYTETRKLLRRGLESPVDKQATIRACKENALERLNAMGFDDAVVERAWVIPGDEFFLRHTPRVIADITRSIVEHDVNDGPLVLLKDMSGHVPGEGATEIYVYTLDQPGLFAASVVALDQLNLSVFDANIHTADHGMCFNIFVVLDEAGSPIGTSELHQADQVAQRLIADLSHPEGFKAIARRRVPRAFKQLLRPTEVHITNSDPGHSELTVVAADRPGLLARIGQLLAEFNIDVLSARITTLGERVEDGFSIRGPDGLAIVDSEKIYTLENTLRQRLDSPVKEA
jgi:[protein-PII] uridylyltransferase